MLSIIIPTLNEQDYLPRLLESIKKQNIGDYEVVVADAGSTDNTLAIAQQYNCKVTPGGLPGPGRNRGADVAAGDLLFFLDADTELSDHFLEVALREFAAKKMDVASFFIVPSTFSVLASLFFILYNLRIELFKKILPHGAIGIMMTKDLFIKLKGYDETLVLAEDRDIIERAAKAGRFDVIKSKILVSDRRFRKDGWFKTGFKYIMCELYLLFIGPIKTDIFHYEFDHYKKKNK